MPPKPRFGITKELLEELHLNQKMTPKDISLKLGCDHTLVLYYLKKYNIKKLPKYERLEGMRFGRLLVLRFLEVRGRSALWECACDCGKTTIATTANLKFGKVQSCGCLAIETSTKHGLSSSRPYRIWMALKTRCDDPDAINYHLYGGRGIAYDPRWKDFNAFWEDMGESYREDLTIERVNNNKGYSKENCIWIDRSRQNFNKRSNVVLTLDGRRQTATEWAQELNINRKIIYYLHDKGLSDVEIFDKILH